MKQKFTLFKKTYYFEFGFFLILILLLCTSLLAIYTSYNLVSDQQGPFYLLRQILWYTAGFVVLFWIQNLNNQKLDRLIEISYQLFLGLLLYLALSRLLSMITSGTTLPFASPRGGAFGWISLPFGFSIQPSEFMKIILLIRLSRLLARYERLYPESTLKDDLKLFLIILRISALPLILILLEPDTGMFLITTVMIVGLTLCSRIHKIWIISLVGLIGGVLLVFFYLYFFQRSFLNLWIPTYQLARIDAWLNPDSYIQGSSNQLYTALLSIGSAGLFGYGIQSSTISIPEAHTDFIFAAFGQSFGLVGTTFILLVCLILDLYLLRIAANCKSRAGRYLCCGTLIMLLYQQIQNLGMIVGLIPITGITLPLISYGGSSILSYFVLFAFIFRASPISKKSQPLMDRLRMNFTNFRSRQSSY